MSVILGNKAYNPLHPASSVTLGANKYNINSSALFSCHHLTVIAWFYNAVLESVVQLCDTQRKWAEMKTDIFHFEFGPAPVIHALKPFFM